MALSDFIKITNSPSHKDSRPTQQKVQPAANPLNKSQGMDSNQILAIVLLLIGLAFIGAAILLW